MLHGLLRYVLLSSTINDIDDTFLLAGVGISRYAPQRSGTDYCTLSIAIIYFRLLHCAFAFSGQNTPGSVNLTPISVHSIQGLFH